MADDMHSWVSTSWLMTCTAGSSQPPWDLRQVRHHQDVPHTHAHHLKSCHMSGPNKAGTLPSASVPTLATASLFLSWQSDQSLPGQPTASHDLPRKYPNILAWAQEYDILGRIALKCKQAITTCHIATLKDEEVHEVHMDGVEPASTCRKLPQLPCVLTNISSCKQSQHHITD